MQHIGRLLDNLNAIYSWRGCDKAQASALWNRKINNPPVPSGARRIFYGTGPPNSQQIPPLIELPEEPDDSAVGCTQNLVRKNESVCQFSFTWMLRLRLLLRLLCGEDLWVRQFWFNRGRMESGRPDGRCGFPLILLRCCEFSRNIRAAA